MDSEMESYIILIRDELKKNHHLDDKSVDSIFKKTNFLSLCQADPDFVFHYQQEDWAEDLLEAFEKTEATLYKREFIENVVNGLVEHYKIDHEKARKMVGNYGLSILFDKYPEELNHVSPDFLNQAIYDSQKELFQEPKK